MGLEKEKLQEKTEMMGNEWEKIKAERGKFVEENSLKRKLYWGASGVNARDLIGAQLMVVTFSPVSDNVQAVVATCKRNVFVSVLKLHEFNSSTELTEHVQAFFTKKHEGFEEEMLVIQCDPVASSLQCINHAKYIVENERSSYLESLSHATSDKASTIQQKTARVFKHVIVLVHLNRGYSSSLFTFDFDHNWFNVFLDDIKPDSMLLRYIPQTIELLRGTEMELLRRIQLKPTLRDTFRSCLARLIYPYLRTSHDVQEQIEMMLKLLDDAEFITIFEKQLFRVIEKAISNRGLGEEAQFSWQEAVAHNIQQIASCNTFREALFVRLSNTISNAFTMLLCHVDRNSNIAVYYRNGSITKAGKLWLSIFQDPQVWASWELLSVGGSMDQKDGTRYDILSDGKAQPFKAKFPFSIEAMRDQAEKLPGSIEDSIYRLFKAMHTTLSTDTVPNQELLLYLHDFIQMKGFLTKLDSTMKLNIHQSIIIKGAGELTNISQVHASFWRNENRIQNIFQLMDDFGADVGADYTSALEKLNNDPLFSLHDLDLHLVDLIIRYLTPSESTWTSRHTQYKWTERISQASASLYALLKLQDHKNDKNVKFDQRNGDAIQDQTGEKVEKGEVSRSSKTLYQKLQCLSFIYLFVRDVALPLSLPLPTSLHFSSLMLAHCDFTLQESFNALVTALQQYLKKTQNKAATTQKFRLLVEIYVAQFCLNDSKKVTEVERTLLLDDFVQLVGDQHPCFSPLPSFKPNKEPSSSSKKDSQKDLLDISASLRRYILRVMLSSPDTKIVETIKEKLHETIAHLPPENPACVLISECLEDIIWDANTDPVALAASINTTHLISGAKLPKLQAIGAARYFFSHLAKATIRFHEEGVAIPENMLIQADRYLGHKNCIGHARVYFLKQVAKHKGLSFAQELLGSAELQKQMKWIIDWLQDVRVKRFMRRRHLLTVDPFLQEKHYTTIRNGVRSAVEGDTRQLVSSLPASKNNPRYKRQFLLSVFHEVYLMYTRDINSKEEKSFSLWLSTQQAFFAPAELFVLLAFSRNVFLDEYDDKKIANPSQKTGGSVPSNVPEFFRISKSSTAEHIALLSIVVHACGLAMTNGPENKPTIFQKMLFSPTELANLFLPSLPDDDRQVFMTVLGGGWYECANGHTYHVDQCGRPTQQLTCPTCGSVIGGIDHVLDPSNKESSKEDKTLLGYFLGAAQEDVNNHQNPYAAERSLSPVAFRLVRLLTHALLLVGFVTIPTVHMDMHKLLARCSANPSSLNIGQFLLDHLKNDWDGLCKLFAVPAEDVSLIVNMVISGLTEGVSLLPPDPTTKESRVVWEARFKERFVNYIVDSYQDKLKHYYNQHDQEDSIVGELRETIDINAVRNTPVAQRGGQQHMQPLTAVLWRYRVPLPMMTMEHLKTNFLSRPEENKLAFPVLHLFITQEEQLRSLRYLRAVLEWQKLLSTRFGKRIDREYARTHTIADVLSEIPMAEKKKWVDACEGFCAGWNEAWRFVDRFVCMEIPPVFRDLRMNENTHICFSLPDERDEGICPSSFVRFLVDKHNQFLQQVQQILQQRAIRDKKEDAPQGDVEIHIPTHLISDLHLITYTGSEKDLGPFLQTQVSQSLQYGQGTNISFDFERIEQHVIDTILSGKPLIDLEIRKFDFANESRITGALQSLKQKISQLELTSDAKAAILQNLGDINHIRRCLNVIEICIGFLAATGSAHMKLPGEMWLADYVRDTLLMGDCSEICAPTSSISKHVQLQHILSLWSLLDEKLNVDPFKDISHKYKRPLQDDMVRSVTASLPHLSTAVLIPVFKEFMLSYLNEASASLGEDLSLKVTIGYCEVSIGEGIAMGNMIPLSDLDWFVKHFPANLQLKHALEVFKMISKTN